ncbi:MAG: hypothetical protein HOV81_24515 [Kofleriaceae bacterium]|nr:hypothetical protein [Kofleriaceae bacterium]
MRSLAVSSVLALSLCACAADEPVDVYMRACNDTGSDITDLTYHWLYSTPALAAGACTEYVHSTKAVPYDPHVVFTIASANFLNRGEDVVGTSVIESGRWTYRLTIYDADRSIAHVEAVADE